MLGLALSAKFWLLSLQTTQTTAMTNYFILASLSLKHKHFSGHFIIAKKKKKNLQVVKLKSPE